MTREYGESDHGRVAHIYREDEDLSLCGVELHRSPTERTAWTLCRKCEAIAGKSDAGVSSAPSQAPKAAERGDSPA